MAALALLAVTWALTFVAHPWSDESVSDLYVYRSAVTPMLHGSLPYRDVPFEYPPLAAAAIAVPGLVGTGEHDYRLAFAALTLLLAAGVVLLTGALARHTGGDPRRAMVAVALAPLLTGAMIRTHFDLAPVALVLGALLCLCRGRPTVGFVLLGLGVMTKVFPLVVAPVALAWLVARGEGREALRGVAALAATVAAVGALAVAASPGGALDAMRYHVDRPVQVESTPALALRALDAVGAGHISPVKSFRSDGLEDPAGGAVTAVFTLGLLVALGALAWATARGPAPPDARRLVLASLAAVAAFAAFGKVLSPQFLMWVVPLGALALAWGTWTEALLAAAAAALTLAEFPSRYFDLVAGHGFPLALVAARDLLLVGLVGVALMRLRSAGGGNDDLLDAGGPAVVAGLDQHPVEPRVLV